MINTVWLLLLLSGIVTAAATGKIMLVSDVIFSNTAKAIEFSIGLAGTIAFWSGILKVAETAGVTAMIAKLFQPFLKWLFPSLIRQSQVLGTIALALAANLLGLGNVATPLGLEAMAKLQELNADPERVSKEIATFLALILGGLTILPSTLIAVRAQAGSKNPSLILVPVFIVSLCGTVIALIFNQLAYKVLIWYQRKE
ncbi:MAG TPA: nucleoside recognition domain-containing protein [Bacillota bacterium]